ncbi:hypothetical protein P7C73_g2867, partial [Tremellales sp. Uapishka_1]
MRDLVTIVLLTLLLPRMAKSFKISHQEMIKGIRIGGTGKTLAFYDTLEVPIIENTADEEDLTDGMAAVSYKFEGGRWQKLIPANEGNGRVPRRTRDSGAKTRALCLGSVFGSGARPTWTDWALPAGNTWEQAKTQAECLDYLFEIATKMLINKIPLEGDA